MLQRSGDVVDDRVVPVHTTRPGLITLEPLGTRVWEAIERSRDSDSLADQLLPFGAVARQRLRVNAVQLLSELQELKPLPTATPG